LTQGPWKAKLGPCTEPEMQSVVMGPDGSGEGGGRHRVAVVDCYHVDYVRRKTCGTQVCEMRDNNAKLIAASRALREAWLLIPREQREETLNALVGMDMGWVAESLKEAGLE